MKIIITIFFLLIAFFTIYKIKMYGAKGMKKHWFAVAFAIKVILASAMIFMYSRTPEIKTNADIFRYYNDAQVIYNSIKTDPTIFFKLLANNTEDSKLVPYYKRMDNWNYSYGSKIYSNNRFIIRYIALFSIITFGSYGAMVVITIFLSFTGLFWIFRFFNSKIKGNTLLIFLIVFLTPSIAFWSSGILKESLLIFFIGLFLNCGSLALKGQKPIARAIIVLLTLIVIFQLKAIVLLLLLPSSIAYLWNHFIPNQRAIIPYFILFFVSFSLASESNSFLSKGLFELLQDKQSGFIEVANHYNPKSIISPIVFESNAISIASNSPIAIVNVLFRPALWEAYNIQSYASAIENIAIFISLLLIIISPKKEIDNKNLFLFTISFALSFIIIIGLSTPILGAISRYRIIPLLFIEMSIIQIIDTTKIKSLFPFK